METMEFNLLRERWVRVRTQDCTVQEVSLTDALLHAHAYVDLAGEMPTQDAAMLVLLLDETLTAYLAQTVLRYDQAEGLTYRKEKAYEGD